MKIKLFDYSHFAGSFEDFENEINNFIRDKRIIDIRLSTFFEGPKEHFESKHYTILILYE